jgi:hypothetical protein
MQPMAVAAMKQKVPRTSESSAAKGISVANLCALRNGINYVRTPQDRLSQQREYLIKHCISFLIGH